MKNNYTVDIFTLCRLDAAFVVVLHLQSTHCICNAFSKYIFERHILIFSSLRHLLHLQHDANSIITYHSRVNFLHFRITEPKFKNKMTAFFFFYTYSTWYIFNYKHQLMHRTVSLFISGQIFYSLSKVKNSKRDENYECVSYKSPPFGTRSCLR